MEEVILTPISPPVPKAVQVVNLALGQLLCERATHRWIPSTPEPSNSCKNSLTESDKNSRFLTNDQEENAAKGYDPMMRMADKIMKRVSAHGSGKWVYTPKDFLDLGSREAVDQALSRLVKTGQLRRVAHGLYDMPRISNVLKRPAPVDLDAAIAALVRRDGVRIMPDGLVAANQLGFTNAVPAKVSYVTDGHSRTLKIDGRTVRFRHAGPSVMKWAGKPAAPVVQALRWLGPDAAADARVVSILRRHLPDDVKLDLLKNSRDLPGWALSLARSIASA